MGPGLTQGLKRGWGEFAVASCGNELVGRLTKRTVRTEGDRAEAYVEPLLVDDLVGPVAAQSLYTLVSETTE